MAIVKDEPITWNVAKIEIENNSAVAKEILNQLVKLKIIKK